MNHWKKRILAGSAVFSASLLQMTGPIAGIQAVQAEKAAQQGLPAAQAESTVKAKRASEIEAGKSYIIAGGNTSLDQILSAQIVSGSKVSSVFKAISLPGLDLSRPDQEITGQEEWVWTASFDESGKIALQNRATGLYMQMQEGQRPIGLGESPVYVSLKKAAHTKGGQSFSLNLGTWYMNYSETQYGFSFYDGTKYGQDETAPVNQLAFFEAEPAGEPVQPEVPDQPAGKDALANVLFLSDFQTGNEVSPYTSKDDVPESLRSVIRTIGQTMKNAGFTQIDGALYCGDYSAFSGQYNYDADPSYGLQALNDEVQSLWNDGHDTLAIQGNHDLTDYPYSSGAYEFEDYSVYAINTMYQADSEGSFPWYQGSSSANRTRVQRLAASLDAYLEQRSQNNDRRPLIVMSHVPLHFSGRVTSLYGAGDNMNAQLIFDVLNEHGQDQDIVFLFGHNHSNGWDSYLGGSAVFRQPGDHLAVPDASKKSGNTTNAWISEELTFTYMNAGYVGYWKHGTADSALTASMCQIYPDRLEFRRYSQAGLHPVGSMGSYNDKYPDQSVLGDFEIVHEEVLSPATVLRNTGEPALSIQSDAGTAGSEMTLNALT